MTDAQLAADIAGKVDGWTWRLEAGEDLRSVLIEAHNDEEEINGCPLAMAVLGVPTEDIAAVLRDSDYDNDATTVHEIRTDDTFMAGMDAMARSCGDARARDEDTMRYAAALRVDHDPTGQLAEALLGLSQALLAKVQTAADDPGSEGGALLVRAVANACGDQDLVDDLKETYDVDTPD